MPRGYGTCFPFERFPALKTLLIWIYPAYVRANSLATTMQEMSHANRKDGIVVIIRDADVFEWEPELLALPSLHLPTAIEWG
jgi:hypothetical protein